MRSEPFISFAQNREDVVLRRALSGVRTGRYVDVGANDPTVDSVSRLFYDAGWSGITVEPVASFASALRAERPRDQLFEVAATDVDGGEIVLHEFADTGLSTAVEEFAERHLAAGREMTDVTVPTRTLDSLLAEAGWDGADIHFMVVDVEGAEAAALRGIDLRRWRPWIVVVEATEPTSATPTHDRWESLLTDRGYRFAQFDGLSRFYVADEKWDEVGSAVEVPAGPLDDFVPHRVHALTRDLAALTEERDRLAGKRNELGGALAAVVAERDVLARQADLSRTEARTLREQLDTATEAALAWRGRAIGAWSSQVVGGQAVSSSELDRLSKHVDAVNGELARMRATVSWRVTAPLRAVRKGTRGPGQ